MSRILMPWVSLRSAVDADDTALTTFDYDSWPSSGAISISPSNADGTELLLDHDRWWIAFYGKDADNEDCAYNLYGRRRTNGPILLLAAGVITLGSRVVTKDPITKAAITAFWADTITITDGLWTVLAPAVIDSADNRIALLAGRNYGIKDLYLELDLDGGSETSAEMNAIITGCQDY